MNIRELCIFDNMDLDEMGAADCDGVRFRWRGAGVYDCRFDCWYEQMGMDRSVYGSILCNV